MTDTVAEPQLTPTGKPKQTRTNYAKAGVLAATTGLTWDEIAPKVGAKNGHSLRVNLSRKGVTKRTVRQAQTSQSATATAHVKLVSDTVEALKTELNDEIMAQLRELRAVPVDYQELFSKGQGRAGMVKQVAETFRAVNGNPDSISIQFGASMISDAQPPVISVVEVAQSVAQLPESTDKPL